MQDGTVRVAYLSPAGSTRNVAETIADEVERQGRRADLQDLAGPEPSVGGIYEALAPGDLLFVGSPTYALHPVPSVMEFLAGLPAVPGAFAVPFVTYGVVTSGVALLDMARALAVRGLGVLGGIKVPALHSLLWQAEAPLGAGHPGEEDTGRIREFVREVLKKDPEASPLPPETLDYQGEKVKAAAAESGLHVLKAMFPPLALDPEACTQCGVCEESCPVGNISLSPDPVFGDRCILCFNCVRLCEPGAVTNPVLSMLEPEIRKRRDAFNETLETRFFL